MAVLLITLLLIGLTAFVWWRKSQNKGKDTHRRFLLRDAPPDTVILHQFGPAPYVPSISPFVIKLETFLRVTKVPYVNRFDRKLGPKGKIPWLQYNDDVITDSQHCMEFVNKTFQVDLNKRLTSKQLALGHIIRRTLEEWTYWILIMYRLVFEPNATLYRSIGLSRLIVWYMRWASSSRVLTQGIGAHSEEEVLKMMKRDLKAMEELLGDRKFMFGDNVSDVTEFDCALFGQMSQLAWQTPGNGIQELIEEEHPRLLASCQRMKEAFWPDWDERLLKPANEKTAPSVQSTKTASSAIKTTTTTATTETSNPPTIGEKEAGQNGHLHNKENIASTLSFKIKSPSKNNNNNNNNNNSNDNNINAINVANSDC